MPSEGIIERAVRLAEAIDGWMYPDELAWLASQGIEAKLSIELGSWKGRSTKAIAVATTGVLYAVDHWLGSQGEREGPHAEALQGDLHRKFVKNLLAEIQSGKVIPVEASHENLWILEEMLAGRRVDFIFIDGEHTYEAVKRDISTAFVLVRPGGLLSGHDYSTAFPGVVRAVQEMVPNFRVGPGSIWSSTV